MHTYCSYPKFSVSFSIKSYFYKHVIRILITENKNTQYVVYIYRNYIFRNSLLQNKSVIFCKCGVRVDTEVSKINILIIRKQLIIFYLIQICSCSCSLYIKKKKSVMTSTCQTKRFKIF